MFQLFLARAFRGQTTESGFKARLVQRDAETDRLRVKSIISAIETALAAAEAEHSGLSQRVENVLARASLTVGNDTDEYLSREPLDTHHQRLFDNEISNGQRRLQELAAAITHFSFLKAATLSRFSDFKRSAADITNRGDQSQR
jgi:hypothetical protein